MEEQSAVRRIIPISIVVLALLSQAGYLMADDDPNLSIFDIQYTTDPTGDSPYAGRIVDCLGGIVTHKFAGYRPKLTLYDPCRPDCWGGIQVKDWISPFDMFNSVQVGDWVSFENVLVEEYRGNTMLQYQIGYSPEFTVVSTGNPMPMPLRVNLDEITSPREGPPGDWYMEDHRAEKYEHLWLRVEKITVTRIDLGKADDNYVLQSFEYPSDPNWSCWAADYMNVDTIGDYHPYVELGSRFCAIEGILEQYTKTSNGWDYYQLLTTTTDDFTVGRVADFDDDCDVDLLDFGLFAAHWLEDGCEDPNWCGGADLSQNGCVDPPDLEKFSDNWLSK